VPSAAEREAAAAFVQSPRRGRTPRRTGADFVADVAACAVPPGMLAVWYLGQESVIWKAGGSTVWIDPYLSAAAGRRYPPLCAPGDVTAADLVLITHEHADHLDPATCAGIAAASPGARFVAPPCCAPLLREAGVPDGRVATPATGETAAFGPWRITPVPAAHEQPDWEPGRGHRFVGYVGECDGLACYHAGDTTAADEVLAALLPWVGRLDLAMLPINGRDYFRLAANCIGNFTFREAAEVAVRLDPALTVPLHFDLFHGWNDERPGHFVDYLFDRAPYLPAAVMAPGQRLFLGRRAPAAG
jgi:L-ascorbate 6-phosphate lactonase